LLSSEKRSARFIAETCEVPTAFSVQTAGDRLYFSAWLGSAVQFPGEYRPPMAQFFSVELHFNHTDVCGDLTHHPVQARNRKYLELKTLSRQSNAITQLHNASFNLLPSPGSSASLMQVAFPTIDVQGCPLLIWLSVSAAGHTQLASKPATETFESINVQ
jgi:hypothetical protein